LRKAASAGEHMKGAKLSAIEGRAH
jgi:hypothetical protein